MMEYHEFCDDCSGCRPALLNVETKQVLSNDDPIMVIVNRVWDNDTTYAQRRAFIEVTLHNSNHPAEIRLFEQVSDMIHEALHKEDNDYS
jgi:hypothetical protein